MPAAIFARLKNALLALLVLWVSTTLAPAASPSLGAIRPIGAQRGTEIEVTLSGARLGDAKRVAPYPDLGQSADPSRIRPVPSRRPRSFQVLLEAENARLGAKLHLDCSEITLRLRDRLQFLHRHLGCECSEQMSRLVAEVQRLVKVFERRDDFLTHADRGHSGTLPFSAQVDLEAHEKVRRPGRGRLANAKSPPPSPRLRYQARLYDPSFVDIHHAGRTRIADRRPSRHFYHNEPHPLTQVTMEPMHPHSSAHAVWIAATSPRPSSAIAWALRRCLRTLPVTVRGRDCTIAMCWGILK